MPRDPNNRRSPKGGKKRDAVRSRELDVLASEGMIMEFLQLQEEDEDGNIPNTSQLTLFDFRKYIQDLKDGMKERFEH